MESLGPGDPREVGPYRLAGVLGSGGMGRVYLGHSRSGRAVAIKMVHTELALNPAFRARFAREIAAARSVSGVFTAAVVDADPTAERPWLATAYVEAPTLSQHVAAHGPLPEPSLRFLAAGLAEALDAIHRAGVIHRDLKPSNVMLAPDGPRVIDFGIARALEEARAIPGGPADADAVTGAQQVLGSPGFMAPEQLIAGSELGPACDVFCLGLVLCFAAGVAPYGAGPVQALLYRIVHESPDLSGVPEGPRAIVAACLAKDPAARPTSAQILDLIGASDALAPAPTVKMPRSHGSHESYTRVDTHLGPSLSPSLGANLGQNLSPNLDTAARAVPSTAAWPSSAPPTLSAVSAVSPQFSAHQVPAQQPPTQQVPAQQFLPATPHPMPPYRPYSPDNAYILKPRSSGRRIGMLIGIPVAIAALAGVVALVAATAGRDSHSGGPTGGSTAPASTGPTR